MVTLQYLTLMDQWCLYVNDRYFLPSILQTIQHLITSYLARWQNLISLKSVKYYHFQEKCILYCKYSDVSAKPSSSCSQSSPSLSKPNLTSLALLLVELAYLAMLCNIQLIHIAGSVHQWEMQTALQILILSVLLYSPTCLPPSEPNIIVLAPLLLKLAFLAISFLSDVLAVCATWQNSINK